MSAIATAKNDRAAATTQNDIDTAKTTLTTFVNGKAVINRTALNAALAEAAEKVEDDYNADVWEEFERAWAQADAVKNSRDQSEIDEATTALTAAMDALDASNSGSVTDTDSRPVTGIYVPGSTAAEVISVDVSWGKMEFTYKDAVGGSWNAAEHDYVGDAPAFWSCAPDANKITVTNHSNTAIEAQLAFAATSGLDITGSFTENYGLTENDGVIPLDTAVTTTFDTAPKAIVYFNVAGTIGASGKLGDITITIVNK